MTFADFLKLLKENPSKGITLTLPDGSTAPDHFHITEIGACSKEFIDCGGKRHHEHTGVLQVWVANDYNHRIQAGKLAHIVELAADLFPNPEVEIEFEIEAPVLTRLPIASVDPTGPALNFILSLKKADCLAKDICLPKPDFSLPEIPTKGLTGSLQTFKRIKK